MAQAPGAPAASEVDPIALHRAERSVRCLPFRRAFYVHVAQQPISSRELCQRDDGRTLVFVGFGPERCDDHFRWLIRLGVLRREVDGQGLNERVRLTPLGRRLLERLPGEIPRAGLRERLHEHLRRQRPRF